jgi:YidC/Oxa1 family membrane protein insertase
VKKENKLIKRILMFFGLFFFAFLISGCTKSFCTVSDQSCLYAAYVVKNQETIDSTAKTNGYFIPGDKFWTFISDKVDAAYTDSINGTATSKFAPDSYVESNKKYHDASTTEEEKATLVDDFTLKAVIRYSGFDSNGNQTLWANFDAWTAEAENDATLREYAPTAAYMTNYKSAISKGVGTAVTCITPTAGYFGLNENTYVEGKTWAQSFHDYGFIEGLFVYPVGWLVYNFAIAFGATGTNATGQILSIFLVTLIVRFFIVLASLGSNNSQNKMNELQPQIALLQAKYPNANENKYEQQQLTQETMALYKKNGVHPFKQILILLVQFPIFIAVWGALQGSAILTKGSVFGLSLATVTWTAMTAHNSETPFAIILFVLMAIAQFFSSMIPMWMQNWHKARIVGANTVKKADDSPTSAMLKYMPYMMMIFVIIMGFQLPAAMGIYWFFSALISIIQVILTEIIQTIKKNKRPRNNKSSGGDSSRHGSFKPNKEKHMKLR